MFRSSFLAFIIFPCLVFSENAQQRQIAYLAVSGQVDKAIFLYQNYIKDQEHDPRLLKELAETIIQKGCISKDLSEQTIALYGAWLSKLESTKKFLYEGICTKDPNIQMLCLQLVSSMHDDFVEQILCEAMSSPFFPIRLEALYHLCARKSRFAIGHIDSLRNLVPEEWNVFFPELYGLLGTPEALKTFKHLLTHPLLDVRISAILTGAKYGRDDLLGEMKRALSHQNPAEQEAAAFSIGILKDLSAKESLVKLTKSQYSDLKIAAALALTRLGEPSFGKLIQSEAINKHLFAIHCLQEIPDSKAILYQLMHDKDFQVRINAAITLLHLGDPLCYEGLEQLLICRNDDLGYLPSFSFGRSMMAWKVIPSIHQQPSLKEINVEEVQLSFKEQMLAKAIDLPEKKFLKLARKIFEARQMPLVPLLVQLLENVKSDEALALLKEFAQKPGVPLIRGYCALALYRISDSTKLQKEFLFWIQSQKGKELIQFRPLLSHADDIQTTDYEVTPQENSRLLIESIEALAEKHHKDSIDVILTLMKDGNPQNRALLAGFLINIIE